MGQQETHAPQHMASLFDQLIGELLKMQRHIDEATDKS
jgi:hypothetical protein